MPNFGNGKNYKTKVFVDNFCLMIIEVQQLTQRKSSTLGTYILNGAIKFTQNNDALAA